MQRGQARRPRNTAFRLFAGLLVVAFTLGQALLTAHLALVPHRICAEHGVAEHGAVESRGSTARTAQSAEKIGLDARATPGQRRAFKGPAVSSPGSGESHESCELHATRHAVATLPAEPFHDLAADYSETAFGSVASQTLPVAPDVLGFAPKQSPPVA